MPSPGTYSETLLIRTTVVSAALQALVGRLVADGVLDQGDLVAMREVGLELASDLAGQSGRDELGRRLSAEAEAWWSAAESLAGG